MFTCNLKKLPFRRFIPFFNTVGVNAGKEFGRSTMSSGLQTLLEVRAVCCSDNNDAFSWIIDDQAPGDATGLVLRTGGPSNLPPLLQFSPRTMQKNPISLERRYIASR
jgi:hypothetical protein